MRTEVHHPESLGIQDCERHARDKLLLMDMHEEDRKRERQGAVIMKIFTALEGVIVSGLFREYYRRTAMVDKTET